MPVPTRNSPQAPELHNTDTTVDPLASENGIIDWDASMGVSWSLFDELPLTTGDFWVDFDNTFGDPNINVDDTMWTTQQAL